MDGTDWLADQFETHRTHLRAVAYRMLGSTAEADDAVQEAWLRLSRADSSEVVNLGGWLTTIVARVSLNMLQSRKSRREEPIDGVYVPEPTSSFDPEQEALLADSMGPALLVVLDTLTPAERLAFVLHDLFAVPFDEIAPIIGRSPAAARQLASRARRRIQGTEPTTTDHTRQRDIVDAFLSASRNGDFESLLAMLDPEAVLLADPAAVTMGATAATGAQAVAETFAGRARAAQPALIDGVPGLVWAQAGQPKVVFAFTITGDKITAIDLLADPDLLTELDIHLGT
jgi:RNA polymerase sigma-70 factor (ECF subfamily)